MLSLTKVLSPHFSRSRLTPRVPLIMLALRLLVLQLAIGRALPVRPMALLRSANASGPACETRAIVPRILDMGEAGLCSI